MSAKTALNATYVLFSHKAVTPAAILQPHRDQTRSRCAQAGLVLVAHDTTEFVFSSHREGIGQLRSPHDHGFLMHASLALTADGHRRPLGVLGAHFWTRSIEGKTKKKAKGKTGDKPIDKELESSRWFRQVVVAEEQLGPDIPCVHVADREADSYDLFARLVDRSSRFVIRNRIDRVARSEDEGPTEHIRTLFERVNATIEMSVPIARREPKAVPARGTSLLPREARIARLSIKAVSIQVRKPPYLKDVPMWLDLNVVYVREIDTPEGVESVAWTLVTTEPIDTVQDILAIIEYYRGRWPIEEFFKAIKTGCQVEKLKWTPNFGPPLKVVKTGLLPDDEEQDQ